jgi:hypothetical protein
VLSFGLPVLCAVGNPASPMGKQVVIKTHDFPMPLENRTLIFFPLELVSHIPIHKSGEMLSCVIKTLWLKNYLGMVFWKILSKSTMKKSKAFP